jgi:hypothetical protein
VLAAQDIEEIATPDHHELRRNRSHGSR